MIVQIEGVARTRDRVPRHRHAAVGPTVHKGDPRRPTRDRVVAQRQPRARAADVDPRISPRRRQIQPIHSDIGRRVQLDPVAAAQAREVIAGAKGPARRPCVLSQLQAVDRAGQNVVADHQAVAVLVVEDHPPAAPVGRQRVVGDRDVRIRPTVVEPDAVAPTADNGVGHCDIVAGAADVDPDVAAHLCGREVQPIDGHMGDLVQRDAPATTIDVGEAVGVGDHELRRRRVLPQVEAVLRATEDVAREGQRVGVLQVQRDTVAGHRRDDVVNDRRVAEVASALEVDRTVEAVDDVVRHRRAITGTNDVHRSVAARCAEGEAVHRDPRRLRDHHGQAAVAPCPVEAVAIRQHPLGPRALVVRHIDAVLRVIEDVVRHRQAVGVQPVQVQGVVGRRQQVAADCDVGVLRPAELDPVLPVEHDVVGQRDPIGRAVDVDPLARASGQIEAVDGHIVPLVHLDRYAGVVGEDGEAIALQDQPVGTDLKRNPSRSRAVDVPRQRERIGDRVAAGEGGARIAAVVQGIGALRDFIAVKISVIVAVAVLWICAEGDLLVVVQTVAIRVWPAIEQGARLEAATFSTAHPFFCGPAAQHQEDPRHVQALPPNAAQHTDARWWIRVVRFTTTAGRGMIGLLP